MIPKCQDPLPHTGRLEHSKRTKNRPSSIAGTIQHDDSDIWDLPSSLTYFSTVPLKLPHYLRSSFYFRFVHLFTWL